MAKQINLDKYSREDQLKAIGSYITARERNAFSSGGLQDPYITNEQLLNKFSIKGKLPALTELAEEFYSKRHTKYLQSKMIRRFEWELQKQTNKDIATGIQICIQIVKMNREFLNFD